MQPTRKPRVWRTAMFGPSALAISLFACGLFLPRPAAAQDVQPGLDIFTTPVPAPPQTTTPTFDDFSFHSGGILLPGRAAVQGEGVLPGRSRQSLRYPLANDRHDRSAAGGGPSPRSRIAGHHSD